MRIRSQLRWLRAYAAVNTALVGVVLLGGFASPSGRPRWREVDVERLNVVEPDGRTRLVISNRARSPRAMIRGREFGNPGGTRAGLIFYNDEGTENGGLTFGGHQTDRGPSAGAGLMFDQYEQDQVVALQYEEEGGRRGQGLTILERPAVRLDEIIAQRCRRCGDQPQGPPGRNPAAACRGLRW